MVKRSFHQSASRAALLVTVRLSAFVAPVRAGSPEGAMDFELRDQHRAAGAATPGGLERLYAEVDRLLAARR